MGLLKILFNSLMSIGIVVIGVMVYLAFNAGILTPEEVRPLVKGGLLITAIYIGWNWSTWRDK